MGSCNCRDEGVPIKVNNFGFLEKKRVVQPPACVGGSPVIKDEVNNSELEAEARETVPTNPLEIPKKTAAILPPPLTKANSCPMDRRLMPPLKRDNSAPSALSIYYSTSNNLHEQAVHIDEATVGELLSKKPRKQSLSQRFQIRRKSSAATVSKTTAASQTKSISKKPKKKVRFDDNVIIHRIEPAGVPTAVPDTYKLVITIKQVWLHLDLDRDKHLNIYELRRFCNDVWEDSDKDVHDIMKLYAKANPEKGMNFNEWCSLIKDEDPHLKELVDYLYTIFVEASETYS